MRLSWSGMLGIFVVAFLWFAGDTLAQQGTVPPAGRQRPAAPQQQTTVAPGAVRGQVISSSGEPIRKAEVTIVGGERNSDSLTAITDSNGGFYIAGVSPGQYVATARQRAFARGPGSRAQSIQVASGQEASGVVIRLTPQAVLTGKIVDEDGDPMMDATVAVSREIWQRSRKTWQAVGGARSNDLGEFRVASLPPGRYMVAVSASPSRRAVSPQKTRAEAEVAYASTYYPGVSEWSQAQPIQVVPGQEVRADIQMRRVATYRIRGRVLDAVAGSSSARTTSVTAFDGAGYPNARFARVQADGTFEIAGLSPGSYTLVAARMDRSQQRASAVVQVGNRDLENVLLQVQPPVDVAASVRLEGSEQTVDLGSVALQIEPESLTEFDRGRTDVTRKPDGSFSFRLPAAGKFRVNVQNVPEGTYLKSVRLGNVDVTGAFFEPVGAAAGVEVVLATGAGQVKGSVQSSADKPFANAFLVLAPPADQRSQYWKFKTTSSDSSGTFTLGNIPPGEYSLFAFSDSRDGAWQDPEFLLSQESRANRVKISEKASETVNPKVLEAP